MTDKQWDGLKVGDQLVSRFNPGSPLTVIGLNPLMLKAPHCEFEVRSARRKDFELALPQENLPF